MPLCNFLSLEGFSQTHQTHLLTFSNPSKPWFDGIRSEKRDDSLSLLSSYLEGFFKLAIAFCHQNFERDASLKAKDQYCESLSFGQRAKLSSFIICPEKITPTREGPGPPSKYDLWNQPFRKAFQTDLSQLGELGRLWLVTGDGWRVGVFVNSTVG